MALRVHPADLRSAARLMSRIGEIGGVARDNPWNGMFRVLTVNGRLLLMSADATLSLGWSIPYENPDGDVLDESIEAAGFNTLAARATDGEPYEIARDGGLVLSQAGASASRPKGGTTRLRIPGRACPAFPPRALTDGPDAPGHPTLRWTVPAAPLARALAFVAPFIGSNNPEDARAVATWSTEGLLVGGSPIKAAFASGLSASRTPLSFGRRTALATAVFLEQLRGDVEVRAGGAHFSFTCPSAGHVLEVRGEPAHYPAQLLRLGDVPFESYRVDRKAFLDSVAILEVFLPTRGGLLELVVKGFNENAAIRLSTPGSHATRSSDEFPIIRSSRSPASQPEGPPVTPGGRTAETLFRAKGRLLREMLNAMTAVTLTCHFDPRNRRILLEDLPAGGGAVRSVILSVLLPGTGEEPARRSSGHGGNPDVDPGVQRAVGAAVATPPDFAAVEGERCQT